MFNSMTAYGHSSPGQLKLASIALGHVRMELEQHRHAGTVMTESYLECLNKLIEPLAVVQGSVGLRFWLAEVQVLMGKLKYRSMSGPPLSPRERQVLQWYATMWRSYRGGSCDMGRPEVQIVLLSLSELSMY